MLCTISQATSAPPVLRAVAAAGIVIAAAWGAPARADGLPDIAAPPSRLQQHRALPSPPPPPVMRYAPPPPPTAYYAPPVPDYVSPPPVFYYAPPPPPVLLYAPPPPPAVLLPAPPMPGLYRCPPGTVARYDPAGFGLCAL